MKEEQVEACNAPPDVKREHARLGIARYAIDFVLKEYNFDTIILSNSETPDDPLSMQRRERLRTYIRDIESLGELVAPLKQGASDSRSRVYELAFSKISERCGMLLFDVGGMAAAFFSSTANCISFGD